MISVGLISSVPALAAAGTYPTRDTQNIQLSTSFTLKALFVRNPMASHDKLILLNLTDESVTINRFQANTLVTDEHVIDCNDICKSKPALTIPAGEELAIRLTSRESTVADAMIEKFLSTHPKAVNKSDGVQLMSLTVTVSNNTAILHEASSPSIT